MYQNEIGKACFQHRVLDGYKDSPRRIVTDKVLYNKIFPIASNTQYDDYQWGLNGLQIFLAKNLEMLLLTQLQELCIWTGVELADM